MSTPKTQPTDADVYEFLESAATPRRRDEGLEVVEIFREVTGAEPVMWGPTMVGFGEYVAVSASDPRKRTTWFKTGFSPRKAQFTFYGLNEAPDAVALLPRLGTFTEGVSCVYAKKVDDLDLDVLRQLIAIAWQTPDEPEPS